MATRTFLALDIDEPIRNRLLAVQRQLDQPDARIRWVGQPQLHVTVKFLGDVADDLLPQVCQGTCQAAGKVASFDFHVKGVVCVPEHGRDIRMIWACVQDETGRMRLLHEQLNEALAPLALHDEERSFRPHITLGRIKHVRHALELRQAVRMLAEEDFGVQRAGEMVIYSSVLTRQGPIYAPVARARLG